jgi:hypothetical protein
LEYVTRLAIGCILHQLRPFFPEANAILLLSNNKIMQDKVGFEALTTTEYRMVTPWQQNRYDVMKASVLLQISADKLLIQNGCRRCRELGR